MQQLILAATNLGLGTCWIGGFDEPKVKKVLEVPQNVKVVALTPIGYSANAGLRSKLMKTFVGTDKRKPLSETLHKNKW